MDMVIEFTKVWVDKNEVFGEKPYFLNPSSASFEGLEACYLKKNGSRIQCTKLFYPGRFITILGTPDEFLQKCREGNLAYGLLLEMERNGVTMKEFIKQNERLNNVELIS